MKLDSLMLLAQQENLDDLESGANAGLGLLSEIKKTLDQASDNAEVVRWANLVSKVQKIASQKRTVVASITNFMREPSLIGIILLRSESSRVYLDRLAVESLR